MSGGEQGAVRQVLAAVPTLDAIGEDAALVEALPEHAVRDLTAKAFRALHALQLRALRPTPSDDAERLLTPEQVAERIGVSVSWVYKNTAVLPPRRTLAGIHRWRAADIDAYIRDLGRVAR